MDCVKPGGGAVLVATIGDAGFAGVVVADGWAARGMAIRRRAAARRCRFIARQHNAQTQRL